MQHEQNEKTLWIPQPQEKLCLQYIRHHRTSSLDNPAGNEAPSIPLFKNPFVSNIKMSNLRGLKGYLSVSQRGMDVAWVTFNLFGLNAKSWRYLPFLKVHLSQIHLLLYTDIHIYSQCSHEMRGVGLLWDLGQARKGLLSRVQIDLSSPVTWGDLPAPPASLGKVRSTASKSWLVSWLSLVMSAFSWSPNTSGCVVIGKLRMYST